MSDSGPNQDEVQSGAGQVDAVEAETAPATTKTNGISSPSSTNALKRTFDERESEADVNVEEDDDESALRTVKRRRSGSDGRDAAGPENEQEDDHMDKEAKVSSLNEEKIAEPSTAGDHDLEQDPQHIHSTPQSRTEIPTEPHPSSTSDQPALASVRSRRPVDAKQRSKRLFGGLIGTLQQQQRSLSSESRVTKRRAEIEQRRKSEVRAQESRFEEQRNQRIEKRKRTWERMQVDMDERAMHTRHQALLHQARFLQTLSEPRLFYLPYDLLPDQEDRIDDQLATARTRIEREVAEWKHEKRRRLDRLDDLEREAETRGLESEKMDIDDDDPSRRERDNEGRSDPSSTERHRAATDTFDVEEAPELPRGPDDHGPADHDPTNTSHSTINLQSTTQDMHLAVDGNDGTADPLSMSTGKEQHDSVIPDEARPKDAVPAEKSPVPDSDTVDDEHDNEQEHVLEADEDTVIY